MGLLDSYKANKAIAAILGSAGPNSPEARQALLKLRQVGPSVVPRLLDAMAVSAPNPAIENLLISFVDERSLPHYVNALRSDDARLVDSVVGVLSHAERLNPAALIPLYEDPDVSKKALTSILLAHRKHLHPRPVLGLLNTVPANLRPFLYQLLDQTVSLQDIPDVALRAKSDDPGIRARMAKILGRFSTEASRDTLFEMLQDPAKQVRLTALESLMELQLPVSAKPVFALLRDSDLTVQTKAIEALIKIRDAKTVQYLIESLQDESEYIRRAAVEVLNEVGDQRAVKDLLNALRDKDWWVKVRAADALGSIGGPKVLDAVLQLIRDEDEFLRRTAVEILNSSRHEKAFDYLVEALQDEDWWVRERAADALAALGKERAVPHLERLLSGDPRTARVAIRALASLGDHHAVAPLLAELKNNADPDVRKEAIRALGQLTDAKQAHTVREALTQVIDASDPRIQQLAHETMATIAMRLDDGTTSSSGITQATPGAMLDLASREAKRDLYIDAPSLRDGDLLADRYRVVRQVGSGGFGVVVLVEDTVVSDQFILKFLHPHVYSDANVIRRFTQELRYARKITHPNVIRIYDLITVGQSYAISMEYFPSHSLADEMAPKKAMDLRRGLTVAAAVADGMAAAQHAGVVHRDLKPANILIDDRDLVKVVDFGLASATSQNDARLTRTGLLVGTPTYMAPEQARGHGIDSRTDVYSLGVMMYEMFSGRPPYTGDDPMAILFQHVEGNAAPLQERNPDVPDRLARVIAKAMAADPERRYQDFDELTAELAMCRREMQV